MCVCVRVCVCVCVCVYHDIYVHIYIYKHTYIQHAMYGIYVIYEYMHVCMYVIRM